MTRLSLSALLVAIAPIAAAQSPVTRASIDSSWLSTDSATKTATFQLTSGLTQLNGGLNFNGFNDGKLALTVPVGWHVVMRFANKDPNLPHSAEVVDTTKPMPAGPVEPPAFPRAMTIKLMTGLASGDTDTVRFVADKPGSYMIFCGVPGHGLAGMWIRLNVSPAEKKPRLTSE